VYNCNNVFQNEEVKEKSKQTLMKKLGVDNSMKSEATKEKSKKTCFKNWGVKFSFQSKNNKIKTKQKNLKKYNCENVFQNEEIKQKIKQGYIKKYNVEYPSQVKEIHEKQQMSGFKTKYYKELFYRGTYELDFLEKYYSTLNITKSSSIKYFYENKNKIYYPDFFLSKYNLIVEIKSDYIYNKYLQKNLAKQQACLDRGYNFIFIINKNYEEFEKIIN
jgi:hypothetical protein